MKRLFLIIACVILASPFSWATGQEGDVIVLDGEEWALLDAPLERLDSLTYYHLQMSLDGKAVQPGIGEATSHTGLSRTGCCFWRKLSKKTP